MIIPQSKKKIKVLFPSACLCGMDLALKYLDLLYFWTIFKVEFDLDLTQK